MITTSTLSRDGTFHTNTSCRLWLATCLLRVVHWTPIQLQVAVSWLETNRSRKTSSTSRSLLQSGVGDGRTDWGGFKNRFGILFCLVVQIGMEDNHSFITDCLLALVALNRFLRSTSTPSEQTACVRQSRNKQGNDDNTRDDNFLRHVVLCQCVLLK